MSARTAVVLAAVAFLAVGCGGGTGASGEGARPAAASGQAAQQHARKQKQTSVFTPLTSTIDRAKGVQATVDKQAAKERKLVEQESQ